MIRFVKIVGFTLGAFIVLLVAHPCILGFPGRVQATGNNARIEDNDAGRAMAWYVTEHGDAC
jgi:hypothetical protein